MATQTSPGPQSPPPPPPAAAAAAAAATTTTTAASSSDTFAFPREYSFPAFFTRQPNHNTHHAQRTKWSSLMLAYARHRRLFRLSLSSAADSELFYNRRLDRRLHVDDIRDVVDFMRRDGRAEYVGGGGGSGSGSEGDVVWLYWRKPEEWAGLVEKYVEDTGQKGSVLTVYELVEGEGTRGTDIHGMDTEVLLKALNILVKRGKAQIFGQDDSLGVKFF